MSDSSSTHSDMTPLDIRYQEFRQSLRGYAPAEVRDYLQKVGDRLTKSIEDGDRLRFQIRELEVGLARSREGEADLKRAVVAAERIAREIRSQAEKEAELIRREAEAEKVMAMQELNESVKELKTDIDKLKQERDMFVSQFRGTLESYLSSLERYKNP